MRILSQHYNAETCAFADERTLLEEFKKDEDVKKQMKRVMTFVAMIKVRPLVALRSKAINMLTTTY